MNEHPHVGTSLPILKKPNNRKTQRDDLRASWHWLRPVSSADAEEPTVDEETQFRLLLDCMKVRRPIRALSFIGAVGLSLLSKVA
jgi:hypothetical protein